MNKIIGHIIIISLLGLAYPALAQDCQVIDQFPVEINEPGKYCLDRSHMVNLNQSESAIHVKSSHVELDFRGYTIANPNKDLLCRNDRTEPSIIGVFVDDDQHNVRVTGGSLFCFGIGIKIGNSCTSCNGSHRIDNMRIHNSRNIGIFLIGNSSVIEGNQITKTGNSESGNIFGIYIYESEANTIRNNDVQTMYSGTGIGLEGVHTALVVENRVQNAHVGFQLYDSKSIRYRDNLTSTVNNPYIGFGTDLGNND